MITSLSTITSHHSIILHHSSCVGAWLHLRHGESAVGPAFSWISATYSTLEYIRYSYIYISLYIYGKSSHRFWLFLRFFSCSCSAQVSPEVSAPGGFGLQPSDWSVGCRNCNGRSLDVFAHVWCQDEVQFPLRPLWKRISVILIDLETCTTSRLDDIEFWTSGCLVVGAHGPHAIEPMDLWISNDSNDTDLYILIHCATPKSTSSSWEPSFLSLLVWGWLFQDHVRRSWSWGRRGIFLPSVWMHCCTTITVLSYTRSIHTHYITLLFAAVVVVAVVVAAVFAFLLIFSSGDRTW